MTTANQARQEARPSDEAAVVTRRIRIWLAVFIGGLVLSGITAFPIESELSVLTKLLGITDGPSSAPESWLHSWLRHVQHGVADTNRSYPFLAYGTDWLAFGHLVIAVAFIGPFRDPVRNQWVITFGLIACAAVIPMALTAGAVRGIPFAWRLIDCSFGVVGAVPLLFCRHYIRRLET
jgi:hypothetical protein